MHLEVLTACQDNCRQENMAVDDDGDNNYKWPTASRPRLASHWPHPTKSERAVWVIVLYG